MSKELHLDFETRSEADLKKVGAHAYFEHPSTKVLCAGWAFDDEEPDLWIPDDIFFPERIKEHVLSGGKITAWNAAFERLAWRHIMVHKHNWTLVQNHQWRCTMTEALSMNMPAQLKDAAPAFGLNIVKDDIGHRLMMKMCKPRKARRYESCAVCGEPAGHNKDVNTYACGHKPVYWHEEQHDLLRLGEYCLQDVRVEAEIGRRILRLRPSEQRLYLLDMQINDRGVFIDKKLCKAASHIVETATDRLDEEMRRVTKGAVSACSSVVQLIRFLGERGIKTGSVDRERIEDLLILEIPEDCRRALELRQEGSKTSTAKIISMLHRQQADGRMRGNNQFYGASATGRDAARGAQLQNLTRPKILGSKAFELTSIDDQIQSAIECIYGGSSMVVEMIYGQPLTLIADIVRSLICAEPGNVLRSSDFSNIEGRVLAWLAGQEDKLDAFLAYDNGTGPDLYLIQAAAIYNVSIALAYSSRQIGKVGELSLGFQGGPRAFAKMAKNYGVRIAQQYEGIWSTAADKFKETALAAWDERGRKTGMSREGWLASEVIKLAWRSKNWRITNYWGDVESSAIAAVREPGVTYSAGPLEFPERHVKFKQVGSFLFCRLLSGRALSYPYPRLKEKETPWGEKRQQLVYKSVNQFTKKWEDKAYYGGLGVENITQAVARDIMMEASLRTEAGGYRTVLKVHDEIVTENKADFGSMEEFNRLMTENPPWAEGLPISVGGWEGKRYHK